MAQTFPPSKAPQPDKDGSAAETSSRYLSPPQSAPVAQRLYSLGGPASEEKPNVALKILRDPVARNSFSRIYSGQRRDWNR